jgi:hypothetical protein
VALTNVVVRALPFTCATEVLMKLVPVNVIVNAAPPAPAEVGEIVVSVGTGFGALMVNVKVFDVVPLGNPCGCAGPKSTVGVNTCTAAVPAVRISAAVIAAVSCVALTNVVVRLPPFHCTTEVLMKLLPFTVNVKAGPPDVAELGTSEVIAGIGVEAVNVRAFEVPPPGAGLNTVTESRLAV